MTACYDNDKSDVSAPHVYTLALVASAIWSPELDAVSVCCLLATSRSRTSVFPFFPYVIFRTLKILPEYWSQIKSLFESGKCLKGFRPPPLLSDKIKLPLQKIEIATLTRLQKAINLLANFLERMLTCKQAATDNAQNPNITLTLIYIAAQSSILSKMPCEGNPMYQYP